MKADTALFNHIVVLLENTSTENAVLKRAIQLARLNKAKLSLFRSLHGSAELRSHKSNEQREALLSEHQQKIISLVETAQASDLEHDIIVSWQDPVAEAIQRLCEESQVDLIVKSARRQLRMGQLLTRNKENYFIAGCPAPVWLVKEREWDNSTEVLIGLDMGDDSIENHYMNRKILATGDRLAGHLNAELHVVDCYYGEIGTMHIDYNQKRGFKRVATIREQHIEKLKLYINEYALSEDSLHLESGIPDDAIPEKAGKLGAEVAIIGNNEDSNIVDRMFGDTAQKLVSAMPCDILILKPDG